jgi:hypothetical protein
LESGAGQVFRDRAREERSSPAAAHHKMSQRDDESSNSEEMDGKRTSRQAAWQTEFVPSQRKNLGRQRKGNGLRARDHLRGHTITLRRGPSSRTTLQAWGWALTAYQWAGAAGSQKRLPTASRALSVRDASRRLRPGPSGGASEAFDSEQRQ